MRVQLELQGGPTAARRTGEWVNVQMTITNVSQKTLRDPRLTIETYQDTDKARVRRCLGGVRATPRRLPRAAQGDRITAMEDKLVWTGSLEARFDEASPNAALTHRVAVLVFMRGLYNLSYSVTYAVDSVAGSKRSSARHAGWCKEPATIAVAE